MVSELYYPEQTSTGLYMTGVAEALAGGRRVRVLCAKPTYAARGAAAANREVRSGVEIHRCASTRFPKDSTLGRLANFATFAGSMALRALGGFRTGDTVLVVTNPPILPIVCALACLIRGARLIVKVDDVYPDIMVATGMARERAWVTELLNLTNGWVYHSCHRIVVIGRDMLSRLASKYPRAADRLVVVPNWADTNEVDRDPGAGRQMLSELGLESKFVVQCAGNFGRPHDTSSLLEAATILRDEPEIHFLFIGSGWKMTQLQEQSRLRNLRNVTILPPQPRTEQRRFLNACDIAVSALVPGMLGVSVPSRLYNVMAAGKPVVAVAHAESEIARVVREEAIGWTVPPGDGAGLATAIRQAQAAGATLEAMGLRARTAAEKRFSREAVLARYRELLGSL